MEISSQYVGSEDKSWVPILLKDEPDNQSNIDCVVPSENAQSSSKYGTLLWANKENDLQKSVIQLAFEGHFIMIHSWKNFVEFIILRNFWLKNILKTIGSKHDTLLLYPCPHRWSSYYTYLLLSNPPLTILPINTSIRRKTSTDDLNIFYGQKYGHKRDSGKGHWICHNMKQIIPSAPTADGSDAIPCCKAITPASTGLCTGEPAWKWKINCNTHNGRNNLLLLETDTRK